MDGLERRIFLRRAERCRVGWRLRLRLGLGRIRRSLEILGLLVNGSHTSVGLPFLASCNTVLIHPSTDNQAKLTKDFGAAMYKVSMVGQQPYLKNMVDCSGALPPPTPAFGKATTYPGGYSVKQIQQSCPKPFPKLATDKGVAKQTQ